MMKSLLFVTNDYPFKTGDSAFIRNEIDYVSKKFHAVHILPMASRENCGFWQVPENVVVHVSKFNIVHRLFTFIPVFFSFSFYSEIFLLIKKRSFSFKSASMAMRFLSGAILTEIKIKQILKRDKSICLIYTYWYWYATMAALRLKENRSLKCVTRTHRFDLYKFRNNQNYQPYKTYMDKKIDKIFFISKNGYDYYIKEFAGSEDKKYLISRLGIVNKYDVDIKKSKDKFILLSCSNMVPVKRVDLIVKSLAEIDEISIHWIHIGDGMLNENISSMADDLLGPKKNIAFEFKGYMHNDNLMEYYCNNYVDCFISISESEGLPVSMMEAISFGVPVIATNVGGVSELVNSDIGALLDPRGDIEEVKKAIIGISKLPKEKMAILRKNARLLWESSFNAEVNSAKFAEELASII